MQNENEFKQMVAKVAKAVTAEYFGPNSAVQDYSNDTPERKALIDIIEKYKYNVEYTNALLACLGQRPVSTEAYRHAQRPFPWGCCVYGIAWLVKGYAYEGLIFCTGRGTEDTPLNKGLYLKPDDSLHQGGPIFKRRAPLSTYKPATPKQIDNWLDRVNLQDHLMNMPVSAFIHARELGVDLWGTDNAKRKRKNNNT